MLRLSDAQWERIRQRFPKENIPAGPAGRKPSPTRRVLEAVLSILHAGAQWHMLPQGYPNYKTVNRRFQRWCQQEVFRDVLTELANTLREQGAIDERETFIDAMFSPAKGGGDNVAPTKRREGAKIMGTVDRHCLPLAVSTHTANHHEVPMVRLSFDFYMIEAKRDNPIGARAYDSDKLDAELQEQGVNMITPRRKNRKKRKSQHGWRLRRYERRWIVNDSLHGCSGRLIVRWQY